MSAGIKSLTIKGFKGFGNEITVDFTNRGKNLVIYGENGSGKTSIVEALQVLFDSTVKEFDLQGYRNIFIEGNIEINIKTTEGKDISLKARTERRKDDRENEFEVLVALPNDYPGDVKTYLEALSKSTAILSYRRLMRIYDVKTDEDFFDLFIRNIMAYYLIPPRKEKSLIQELNELERLKRESPRAKRKIEDKEKNIIDEINKIFSEIKDKWNEYIRTLTGDNIEVECSIEKLGSLNFKIKWNGIEVRDIMNYLNEGRLNAISLGLFLAYYKRFNTSPYKLLLLDDVVIGLDMGLRLPLLEILQKDFEEEYQIIITTFDENWFNLMENYLDGSKWEFRKLIVKFTDNNRFPFIIGMESSDYLQKAKSYLRNGDIPAAALYVRLEFERLVTRYAERKKLEVQFKRKSSEIPIDIIWKKVKQKIPKAETLYKKVDIYKSILLNPSVHYDQKPKYRNEVKHAIAVVEKLKEEINKELK
jgi:recombinational DNA repair ATPase RecF